MNQPQFHPKARAELERSALFYNGKFPGLGLEFAAAVQSAVAFAYSHPEAGAPVANVFVVSSFAAFHTQSSIELKANVFTSLL